MPVMVRDIKLNSDEEPRPELAMVDFVVSSEILRLVRTLDGIGSGTIRCIEVRSGVPRRILLESQVAGT